MNDQNDISINNMNQQFYSEPSSDQNHNFPLSATFKSEHHSFSTICSRKNHAYLCTPNLETPTCCKSFQEQCLVAK